MEQARLSTELRKHAATQQIELGQSAKAAKQLSHVDTIEALEHLYNLAERARDINPQAALAALSAAQELPRPEKGASGASLQMPEKKAQTKEIVRLTPKEIFEQPLFTLAA
jgi:hypothetical protein